MMVINMEKILNLINTRIAAAASTGNTTEEIFMKTIKAEFEKLIYQRDKYANALESTLQTNDALQRKFGGERYE